MAILVVGLADLSAYVFCTGGSWISASFFPFFLFNFIVIGRFNIDVKYLRLTVTDESVPNVLLVFPLFFNLIINFIRSLITAHDVKAFMILWV